MTPNFGLVQQMGRIAINQEGKQWGRSKLGGGEDQVINFHIFCVRQIHAYLLI